VNYNRDVEIFPVLRRILEKITGGEPFYKSPTDMGVNRAGFAILDDGITQEEAKQEIIRRYFRYLCEYTVGLTDKETFRGSSCWWSISTCSRSRARSFSRRVRPRRGLRRKTGGMRDFLRGGHRPEGRGHRDREQFAPFACRFEAWS